MHFAEVKGILSASNGMNLYRGCIHGCIYCDSRSACYQFTHAFEDVEVKRNALSLLEAALRARRKKCMIGTGSMSDPYQPCEAKLNMTRGALELICRYGFGVSVQTKSDFILRDIDLLCDINERAKAVAQLTLTCADDALSAVIEPRVCPSSRRYQVLKAFQARSVPTVAWLSPLLPWLTDDDKNFDQLLNWCLDAGVRGIVCFGVGLTLRTGSREYFYRQLDRHFPGLSARYRARYGNAYEVASDNSDRLMARFHETCEKYGVLHDPDRCFAYLAELPPKYEQISMF